jgi:DDE superfamily endonuclease
VILVCDNLDTHTPGDFYEAFDAETARALVRRLEFRHTPKHGSWLNIAECELSAMTRQCIKDRRSRRSTNCERRQVLGTSAPTTNSVESIGNSKSTMPGRN